MRRALLAFVLVQAAALGQQTRPAGETHEGTVTVRIVIGTDGIPSDPEVVRSLSPEADKNAVAAIRQWRFRPAMRDGKPTPVVAVIGIPFRACSGCTMSGSPEIVPQLFQTAGTKDPSGQALLRWYVKAATAGDPDAQIELATLFSSQKEGNYDPERAYVWATIAALHGTKHAGSLRKRLASRISPEQVRAADNLAADWRPGKAVTLAEDRKVQNRP